MPDSSKTDGAFNQLNANALDFLRESIDQLEEKPKYSVINFFTAVELFFKARLMQEHWSLTVSNPSDAPRSKFLEADFVSIGLTDAVKRLKNISPNEALSRREESAYEKLRKRRNKAVHFYDPKYLNSHESEVAVEQLLAWRHLYRRLTVTWESYFESSRETLESLNKRFGSYDTYFDVVCTDYWDQRSEEIRKLKAKENRNKVPAIGFCPFCEKRALEKVGRIVLGLYDGECQVCDQSLPFVCRECPGCGQEAATSRWKNLECLGCGHSVEHDLERAKRILKEEADYKWAFCSMCHVVSEPTVGKFPSDDGLIELCIECGHVDLFGISYCEFCGEFVTGETGDRITPKCCMCQFHIVSDGEDIDRPTYEKRYDVKLPEWRENLEVRKSEIEHEYGW